MRIFTLGVFWGVVVILCGVSILLKAVFNINIPIFRILIGILVISWGVTILFGFNNARTQNTIVFGDNKFESSQIQKEYNVIFGTGLVDLASGISTEMPPVIKVNSVFADTKILVDIDSEITIQASSVFGNVVIPNGDSVVFGSMSRTLGSSQNKIHLEVNTVFGQTKIVYK